MDLPANEIHLYFAWPADISDHGLIDQYKTLLSHDEQTRMSRFHFAGFRHRYLVTRALIRCCLSNYDNVEPVAWQFDQNDYGKPGIAQPVLHIPIRFNISHTDSLIMCGIARNSNIGVDVEDKLRNMSLQTEGLFRFFSQLEIEQLTRLPETDQRQRFFDYWTLKEAYIKARGKGLSISLKKFSFIFQENRLRDFIVRRELDDTAKHWQFWRMSIDERYPVAVAIKSDTHDFKIRARSSVPLDSEESLRLDFLEHTHIKRE